MRTILTMMLAALTALMLASCSGSNGSNPCTISGTLTFTNTQSHTVVISGQTYSFTIDTDSTENNGNEAATYLATWGTGTATSYSFDITSLPTGSYYLYSVSYPPGFMIYGWYGGNAVSAFNPQVQVPVECGSKYDFFVDVT